MSISRSAAVEDLEAAVQAFDDFDAAHGKWADKENSWRVYSAPLPSYSEVMTKLQATFERWRPDEDYGRRALSQRDISNDDFYMQVIAGILRSLRDDYANDRLQRVRQRVRAEVLSDFLDIAEHLLEEENLKDPAAVMAGGVLEQHLRKLCELHKIEAGDSPKVDRMNADLAKAGVFNKTLQKQVTAWAGLRNDAAHAHYGKYTEENVRLMILGIRHLMETYPA